MGRKLNTSTPTVIQTELVPLDENFAIEANGTLEQWYYDNTTQYAPDRSITPLILSPKIMVADKDSQQSWDDAHVTKSVVAWSVMESNTWVDITSASVLSDYELSGNNLIVHKNVSYSQGVTIKCKLTYVDPRDNGIEITTQETVLLTCNRDANVVLPEVAITSPSARSFNPLVDGASTEYDFDAVVTNSPDVEMQSSDIATYEIDGIGTEEIISDANGIAPILDIRYPDSETQTDQEFVYRQTANGEKPDEVGAAFISKIKGNTVAWNQKLVNNFFTSDIRWFTGSADLTINTTNHTATIYSTATDNTDLKQPRTIMNNHKYYFSAKVASRKAGTVSLTYYGGGSYPSTVLGTISENETKTFKHIYTFNNGNGYNVFGFSIRGNGADYTVYGGISLIDLTLIYGAGNEPTTVEEFEADYERWFGKPLSYEEYDEGSLRPVLMQSVKTTGFNQWDEEWELGGIDGNTGGNYSYPSSIRSTNYIKIEDATYYLKSPMYVNARWYDAGKNYLGYSVILPNSTFTKQYDNAAYLRFIISQTTYNNDICINISNPSKNGTYEPYEEHIASVPITSATGRLLDASGNPTGSTVTIFPDGLKKVGNIQDEIFVENGVVKAVKRVGSVDLGVFTWAFNSNTFFRTSLNSLSPIGKDSTLNQINAKYKAVAVILAGSTDDKSIAISDSGTRIRVLDSSFAGDADAFKTAMSGVMLYYELETPQTYVLDPVQNPFIYKWFGIDANNNEVLAETLPWYVSGQDTSKLRVDAMWGEKINVVLRAMMPTGALSPSKAYAALTWRIPDVDTTVVSYNGSAVRSDTNSMTFGTIVNINGRNLEDSVKAANLRFKWVYRKNFTNQETVAGWSQGESDQITIQASNLRSIKGQDSTLASTLVFPYVYCLGAWTTSQGTETGYSKPTTTKNGVTYYRIVD